MENCHLALIFTLCVVLFFNDGCTGYPHSANAMSSEKYNAALNSILKLKNSEENNDETVAGSDDEGQTTKAERALIVAAILDGLYNDDDNAKRGDLLWSQRRFGKKREHDNLLSEDSSRKHGRAPFHGMGRRFGKEAIDTIVKDLEDFTE